MCLVSQRQMKFELEIERQIDREREKEECELAQWNGVVEIRNFELHETKDGRRKGKNPCSTDRANMTFMSS